MPTQGITIKSLPSLSALPEDSILYAVSNDADYKLPISLLKSLILENLPPAEIPEGLLNEDILTARLQNYITTTQIDAAVEAAIPEGLLNEETLTTRLQDYLTTTQVNAAIEAAIPANLVNEDNLNTRLQDYLTSTQTNTAIETAISAIPNYVLPETVVHQNDLTIITQDIQNLQLAVQEFEGSTYVTSEQLTTQLSGYIQTLPANLVYQDALDTLEDRVSVLELSEFITPSQLNTELQAILNQFAGPPSTVQLGKVYYVNVDYAEEVERDGTITAPFADINDAIITAPPGSIILVSPGVYTMDVNPLGKDVTIQGFGVTGSNLVEINGQLLINSNVVNTFRLKDVKLKNVSLTEPVIKITGNSGKCYFENVQVNLIDGSTAKAVEVTSPIMGDISFLNCSIGGEILLNGSQFGAIVSFTGCSNPAAHFNIQADVDVYIDNTTSLNGITHADGNLYVSHTRGFGSIGLICTTGSERTLSLAYCSLRYNTGGFAPYQESVEAETILDYVIKQAT